MMGNDQMPATLRLSNNEQELLRQKCIEINKLLIKMNKQPIKDSELAHLIIEQGTKLVEVSKSGMLSLEAE